jgi:hypothetical protein
MACVFCADVGRVALGLEVQFVSSSRALSIRMLTRYRADPEQPMMTSLVLYKTTSVADNVWDRLIKRGGRTRLLWVQGNCSAADSLIDVETSRLIRDYIFSTLKGRTAISSTLT